MFALMIGAMFPIIHLGRPWLFFWLVPYPSAREIWPNFRSPLVWDFFAINTYLTGSVLFLLLPMIPDFALVRDRVHRLAQARSTARWRSAGSGTTKQWHRLESAMQIMAIAIIPVAVSVHTIVSFDFSMAHGADVALDDLRALLRRRRDLQRHRRADHRDGGAAQVPAPRGTTCTRCTSRTSASCCC